MVIELECHISKQQNYVQYLVIETKYFVPDQNNMCLLQEQQDGVIMSLQNHNNRN